MTLAAAGAVALAAALDRFLSEPPTRVHPVAWLGRAVGALDDRLPDARSTGFLLAAALPTAFALSLAVPVLAAAVVDRRLGAVAAGGALFACSSHRMLVDVARDVVGLAGDDLPAARRDLRALAGRDADALSAGHVRSAAVESVAENLADGLIAPVSAFGLGAVVATLAGARPPLALAVAAGAAAWVKGVNTLDSMLGYRDRRTGWAPARLDDAVMWLPARAASVLIVVSGASASALGTLGRIRSVARVPASPNSGWPMASLAAVLDVRLEKPGAYALFPESGLPTESEARAGVRVVSRAGWLGVGVTGVSLAL